MAVELTEKPPFEGYAEPSERRPLEAYGMLIAGFATGTAAALLAATRRRPIPDRIEPRDLALLSRCWKPAGRFAQSAVYAAVFASWPLDRRTPARYRIRVRGDFGGFSKNSSQRSDQV